MRASNLRCHVRSRHPNKDSDNISFVPASPDAALGSTVKNRQQQVTCPECGIVLRPSNFNRHWSRQHKGLPVPSAVRKNRSVDNGGESLAVATPVVYEEQPDASMLADQLMDSDNDGEVGEFFDGTCGHPGCPHVAVSPADLAIHRRKFNHARPRQQLPQRQRQQQQQLEEENSSQYEEGVITVNPADISVRDDEDEPVVPARVARDLASSRPYACDTLGCGYRSNYRQNLDRHCRRHKHYSEYLLRTSKKPREEMVARMIQDNQMRQQQQLQQESSGFSEEEEMEVTPDFMGQAEAMLEMDLVEEQESSEQYLSNGTDGAAV